MSRGLTEEEFRILEMIQDHYGSMNRVDAVMWTDEGEAVLWVKACDGSCPLVVNLTNLAAWIADGTIPNDKELKREWLHINES